MGASEPAEVQTERRRFITRRHVEDAADAGQPLRVRRRDVVTDEAAQRARDLGVRIERSIDIERDIERGGGRPASPEPVPDADAALRRAVRVAVVAELGAEPPGLDAAIDRVLRARPEQPA